VKTSRAFVDVTDPALVGAGVGSKAGHEGEALVRVLTPFDTGTWPAHAREHDRPRLHIAGGAGLADRRTTCNSVRVLIDGNA
jgi:hypothetical protein